MIVRIIRSIILSTCWLYLYIVHDGLVFPHVLILTPPNVQGGQMDPLGFSDLKFEAFKQSKWNFHYL